MIGKKASGAAYTSNRTCESFSFTIVSTSHGFATQLLPETMTERLGVNFDHPLGGNSLAISLIRLFVIGLMSIFLLRRLRIWWRAVQVSLQLLHISIPSQYSHSYCYTRPFAPSLLFLALTSADRTSLLSLMAVPTRHCCLAQLRAIVHMMATTRITCEVVMGDSLVLTGT